MRPGLGTVNPPRLRSTHFRPRHTDRLAQAARSLFGRLDLPGRGEPRALASQFCHARLRIDIRPIGKCEIRNLARVVVALDNADLLARDVHGTDPTTIL